jgi:hypothetical protein
VKNTIKPNIRISLSPTLDSQRAMVAAMADPERLPYREQPEVELAILPLRERVLKATDLPPDPNDSNLNADQLERRLLGHQLVYVLITDEENRLASPSSRNMRYLVDAHIAAYDDAGRERLVRYCTRPPFALERIELLRDGRVAYLLSVP